MTNLSLKWWHWLYLIKGIIIGCKGFYPGTYCFDLAANKVPDLIFERDLNSLILIINQTLLSKIMLLKL